MEITKKQLLKSKGHSLRMKDLRKFVEKHKDIDDDVTFALHEYHVAMFRFATKEEIQELKNRQKEYKAKRKEIDKLQKQISKLYKEL